MARPPHPLSITSALLLLGLYVASPPDARATSRHSAPLPAAAARALDQLTAKLGDTPKTVRRVVPQPTNTDEGRVVWLGGFRLRSPGTTAAERAARFLSDHGAVLGLDPVVQPTPRRTHRVLGGAVVRFDLRIDGRPLFGRSVAVVLQGSEVTSAAGGLPTLRFVDPPTPLLTAVDAAAAVARASGRDARRVLGLGYLIVGGEARLVWRVDQMQAFPPERLLYAVDATEGEILAVGRGFRQVQGYVYDPSPAVASTYEARTLTDLTASDSLEGTYARAYQCGAMTGPMEDLPCQDRYHSAAPDTNGDYLIPPVEPSSSDLFSEVQAYYHVTQFSKWMESRFGFAMTCGGDQAIDVHVNMAYDNAFWGDADGDPDECGDITLGEGSVDYAYDAEVIYHEFTHGTVEHTAGLGCDDVGVCLDNLGVNLIPNGLNEGLADYFSMTYTDSPNLGEYVGSETGDPYIRTALNSLRCPWDVTAESHSDGEILMGGAWTLRQTLGTDRTDDLVWATLVALPEDANFDVAAATLDQAAQNLQTAGQLTAADVATVEQMIGPNDRNMVGCDRIIPLDNRPPGSEVAEAFGLPSIPGSIDEWPISLQYTLEAPANANRLHVTVYPELGYGTDWTVYLRRDHPVYIQVEMGSPSVTADYTFTGSPTDVILTPSSSPALVPDALYYVAIVYSADDYEMFAIQGDVTTGPVIPPDAAVPDAALPPEAGPPDSGVRPDASHTDARPSTGNYQPDSFEPRTGCNCRTGGGVPAPGLLAGLLLVLVWLRRRRRK